MQVFLTDHHGDPASKTDFGGYRGSTCRYYQVRNLHQRTPRHVYGHGHAGGESGEHKTGFSIYFCSSKKF